jgi:hypothetical protein
MTPVRWVVRHSAIGRNPVFFQRMLTQSMIPACAGMTADDEHER